MLDHGAPWSDGHSSSASDFTKVYAALIFINMANVLMKTEFVIYFLKVQLQSAQQIKRHSFTARFF